MLLTPLSACSFWENVLNSLTVVVDVEMPEFAPPVQSVNAEQRCHVTQLWNDDKGDLFSAFQWCRAEIDTLTL